MQRQSMNLLRSYRYDPLDRLVACATSTQASNQRFYLKDRLATEIQGTVQHSILQHGDQLLAQQKRQGSVAVQTSLLATDQQRSVLTLLDVKQPHAFAYMPYGHCFAGGDLLSLLRFNGERADPVTGWYLLGNGYRAFNPVLMRFNSPDSWSPFGEGGLNTYAYCMGDPLNRSDPTGHSWSFFGKLFGTSTSYRRTSITTLASPSPAQMSSQLPAEAAKSGFFTDALKTVDQSLRRSSKPALGTPAEGRQHISNVMEGLDYDQPFVKRLGEVNKNLASHGNTSLSPAHAREYGNLAVEVSEGQRSNANAHAVAAAEWYRHLATTRRPSGVAGTLMNLGGMFVSGVTDQKLYKTGEVLRKAP